MNAATLTRDALIPRSSDGIGRGLGLALLVHVLLVIAIAFGVSWRSSEPAGVEAELWASVPQIAAPKPVEPEPVVQPKPAPPPPKPEPVQQKQPDAQIAIEKAKKQEEKRKEDAKREELLKQKEEQERKKKEAEARRKEEERLATIREEQMKRIMSQAGATGEPGATGTAQRTAGPSATYAGRIKARILPNVVFSDSVDGNPLATVEVRAAPDGTIIGRRLIKSSGVPAWDEAVLRAIDKTEVLPRDTDGRVPSSFEIAFRVRD
jgi:colicin import membrane protein